MVPQDGLLVILVWLIDLIPAVPTPDRAKRVHRKTYPHKLFLKALVIMMVRQVQTPSGLLAILAQPTADMRLLRQELSLADGRFLCRRTWERRLKAIPDTLPAQIACLGRFLVSQLGLWTQTARAGAIDSTVNRADNEQATALIAELPQELRFLLGDQHYHDHALQRQCQERGCILGTSHTGKNHPYPHHDDDVEVRKIL